MPAHGNRRVPALQSCRQAYKFFWISSEAASPHMPNRLISKENGVCRRLVWSLHGGLAAILAARSETWKSRKKEPFSGGA